MQSTAAAFAEREFPEMITENVPPTRDAKADLRSKQGFAATQVLVSRAVEWDGAMNALVITPRRVKTQSTVHFILLVDNVIAYIIPRRVVSTHKSLDRPFYGKDSEELSENEML